jgi:hypothetical protein
MLREKKIKIHVHEVFGKDGPDIRWRPMRNQLARIQLFVIEMT